MINYNQKFLNSNLIIVFIVIWLPAYVLCFSMYLYVSLALYSEEI